MLGGRVPPSTPFSIPVINLSDASTSGSKRKLGNTGQKRKSSALHYNMAEVAKKAGDSMVQQLKDMSDVNKSAEKEKLEV
jgi:hypothetical protein